MAKKVQQKIEGTCRDCSHSFDYQNESFREPKKKILCRCPFKPHLMLLDYDHCKQLKRKAPTGL